MIIVILFVCMALVIGGISLWTNSYDLEGVWVGMTSVGACFGFIAIIAALFIWAGCIDMVNIDKKLEMYEEENAKIEMQLAECVEKYQNYEQGTFEMVSSENVATLITLFPELKADSLVQKQIETYVANNEKIKELRFKQIDAEIIRWWGYFGK